jgi:antitoxin (DNA-binding transcriptional repressor) of toxin-antitoxin stability system
MTTIPATELVNQLPRILQAIASGEEFLVIEAGRPVARIVPPSPPVPTEPLTADQWQKEFDPWMKEVEARADRYPPGFVLDDSYEAIYGERENAQR